MRNRSSCGEVIENKNRVPPRKRLGEGGGEMVPKLSRGLIAFAFLSGLGNLPLCGSPGRFIGKRENA